MATLGDSITAGSPLWDPDPSERARIGAAADERSQWQWWAAQRDERLEFRNHGVCTERTEQIAARLDAAVEGADVLVVQGGINDVVHHGSIEAAARNLESMVQRGRAHGLAVAVADVLPWNNGDRGHLTAREAVAAFRESGARRLVVIHRPDELPLDAGIERAYDGLELTV